MRKRLAITLLATSLFANIEDIKFEGLNQISESVAKEMIKVNVGDRIDIERIDESIKFLFRQGYFEDIYVTEDDGVLIYHFKEKPIVAKVSVEGYLEGENNKEKQLEVLKIKKGDIYDIRKLNEAKARVIELIRSEGYFDSVVEFETKELNEKSVEVVFKINKGENIFIKELNFCGSEVFQKSEIESVIANREKEAVGWLWGRNDGKLKLNDLEFDKNRIKNLYMQKGYLDAKISNPTLSVDFNSYEAKLDYKIEEGRPYSVKEIDIDIAKDLIDLNSLKEELKLKVGEDFNIDLFRADMERIKERVANLGYAFVEVIPDFIKSSEAQEVLVKYRVIPNQKVYIRDVVISGNSKSLDRVVRREMFLAPKDLYNLTDLKDSKNALRRTGYFERVEVLEKRVSENQMDLIVEVEEAPTGNIMVGGGYGSYGGVLLNASVSDKNIFGSGYELDFSLDYSSKYTRFNSSLYNPRIFDSKYSLGINLYNSEYEAYDYTDKRKGGSITLGKYFTRHLRVNTSYQYVDSQLTDEDTNGTYPTYSVDEIIAGVNTRVGGITYEDFSKSSATIGLVFNNTDDYYVPREGFIIHSSIEYAGLGGSAEFIKNYNSLNYFYGLEDLIDYDLIFRYKARAGYIEDSGYLPINEKFYIGGIRTVRGYESSSLSPKVYYYDENGNLEDLLTGGRQTFSNSIEFSIPLIESAKMRMALFYDYGTIGEDSIDEISRSGTGAAIEWISPVGPIQLVFARAIGDEASDETSTFEFTMGTRF